MDYSLEESKFLCLRFRNARKETYGKTEEIVGNWLKARNNREKIILALKLLQQKMILSD